MNIQTVDFSAKEQKIIEAAVSTFMRYGVKKTTMGDISKGAGISRQTLYASFDSKEDVLAAALKMICAKTIANIETTWQDIDGLNEKLDAYFKVAVIPFFDQLRNMPNYEDFYTGFNDAGRLAVEECIASKVSMLEMLFTPYEAVLQQHSMTAKDIADLIGRSSENFIKIAHDKAHFDSLIKTLRCTVLGLIHQA